MAKNDASGNRIKHIDIKYHLVWNCVSKQKLKLKYCLTADMVADTLSMALSKESFQKCRNEMGVGKRMKTVLGNEIGGGLKNYYHP